MDNVKQLFVRACKSAEPYKRVLSVYRRYYLASAMGDREVAAICGILTGVVDEYCPMTSCEIINEMSANIDWLYPENCSYSERATRMLISKIRLSEASRFPELRWPAKFNRAA